MGILDEDIARVRESSDMVAVVSEHVALKRVGRRYVGLCPFHSERSPSFSVNPELGLYHCFGCQAGGDVIRFVREVEGLEFADAVEKLAARAGLTIRYDDAAVSRDRKRRDRLVEANNVALAYYHRLLLESPEGGAARRYLRSRGFDGDAARHFQLGWAPEAWDRLAQHLQQQGFARDDVTQAGLAYVNRAQRLQDQFRARLIFPILDVRDQPIGFGGRSLGGDGPKYVNTPETALYQKSKVLYGLNWARRDVVAAGEVVVCEGYTDVMAFHLAGAPRAVATCGTALTDEHVRVLKNFARTVTLAFDADSAGQAAADRFYQWEAAHDLRVQVADLPPGRDPADLWLEGPEPLLETLAHPRPFLRFRLDRLLAGADLATAEGRATAASRGVEIVAGHPAELVRDQYVMDLSERLRIDADRLREAVERVLRGEAARPAPRRRDPAARRDLSPVELEALRAAIHHPEHAGEWLDATMFRSGMAREVFTGLVEAESFPEALDAMGPEARSLAERLAVEDTEPGDDAAAWVLKASSGVVEGAARRVLAGLVGDDDERATALNRDIDGFVGARERGDWETARGSVERLVGWVAGRADGTP